MLNLTQRQRHGVHIPNRMRTTHSTDCWNGLLKKLGKHSAGLDGVSRGPVRLSAYNNRFRHFGTNPLAGWCDRLARWASPIGSWPPPGTSTPGCQGTPGQGVRCHGSTAGSQWKPTGGREGDGSCRGRGSVRGGGQAAFTGCVAEMPDTPAPGMLNKGLNKTSGEQCVFLADTRESHSSEPRLDALSDDTDDVIREGSERRRKRDTRRL
eukprot:1177937-Prorocentrum_minimum.AAC.1